MYIMPIQTLLTGFGPFGSVIDNPTERLLRHFAEQDVSGHVLTTCALPTSFARAMQTFQTAFTSGGQDGRPFDLILMLGVAAGSDHWRVETQGLNWDEPGIPDVDGYVTPGRYIVPGGPARLPVTLAPDGVEQAIRATGAPVAQSVSAGAYLCNHLLYSVLHQLQTGDRPIRAGFLHVPADEQTYAPDYKPKNNCVFPFAQHVAVLRAVLNTCAVL
jgi:pyroglutamyl-peptidase